MHDFVKSLGNEWFVFRYEDMIEKNFDMLNKYLGFEIKDDAERAEVELTDLRQKGRKIHVKIGQLETQMEAIKDKLIEMADKD